MSLSKIGRHLYTIDQSGVITAGTSDRTVNVLTRDYTVVILSLLSDVDLTINLLWSNNGSDFVYDSTVSVNHTGDPDHSFYERVISGIFLKYEIVNAEVVDTTVFDMKTYARTGASIGMDGGGGVVEDVWWFREAADPNHVTQLVGDTGNIQSGYPAGGVTLTNQTDPNVDVYENVSILGDASGLVFDWRSKTVDGGANLSFNGSFLVGNENNVILFGPGISHIGALFNNSSYIVIEAGLPAGGAQDHHTRNTIFSSNYDCFFHHARYSTVSNCYNSNLILAQLTPLPASDDDRTGRNFFNSVIDSTINSGVANGIDMSYSSFMRFYNSRWAMHAGDGNFVAGTRILTSLPALELRGVCALTDHIDPDENVFVDPLIVDTEHRMYCRFSNGYNFYTDADSTVGSRLDPGGSMWNPICDVRLKQNLVEYTDSAGVLERVGALKLYDYKNVSGMKNGPAQESARFRITPTAQDFNFIFHPEEGDSDDIIASDRAKSYDKCHAARCEAETRLLEKSGEKDPNEALTPAQASAIKTTVDTVMLEPEAVAGVEKQSMRSLNGQELNAALLLCIKELKTQLEELKARVVVLEGV